MSLADRLTRPAREVFQRWRRKVRPRILEAGAASRRRNTIESGTPLSLSENLALRLSFFSVGERQAHRQENLNLSDIFLV
jgi:hypothetical protein